MTTERKFRRRLLTPLMVSLFASSFLANQVCLGETPKPAEKNPVVDKNAPIKIGFIVSLSGVAGEGGQEMINGIKLYLEQVKHKIAGRPVELIIENDGGDAATALAKMIKLVEQDKVQVLDGIVGSHLGYKLAPYVDKYQVPMIYCVTSGDDLTKRKRSKWVIRTSWSASQAMHPLGEWVYKNTDYRKVITVGLDYSLGFEFVGGFQKSFEDAGGKVVQKLWIPRGFTDFSKLIGEMRPDADSIFEGIALKPAEIFPKQYAELGPKKKLPMVATGASMDEWILRHLGDESIGTISASNYSPDLNTTANKKFVTAYRAKYHEDPSHFAESAFTSGMWIHKAADALSGQVDDHHKFLEALKSVKLADAPRGPLSLDSYGNPDQNIYIRKVVKVKGELKNKVVYTFPKVSQFWKYDPAEFLRLPPYSRDYPPCKFCTETK